MTIIYVAENNCQCLALTSENNGMIRVQNFKDIFGDGKNFIYEVNPMETFIGKSKDCEMTYFSGARDKEVFDGNTISLKIGLEKNKHRYVYIAGDMLCSFLTNDRIYKYISKMGNNLTPCSIAIGWENVYYLTPYFKFIKKENIDEDDIDKLFNIDYHFISKDQKLGTYKFHSKYD